jgi:hypothetical protein
MAVVSTLLSTAFHGWHKGNDRPLNNDITVEARGAVQVPGVGTVFRRAGRSDGIEHRRTIGYLYLAGSPAKSQDFALHDSSP